MTRVSLSHVVTSAVAALVATAQLLAQQSGAPQVPTFRGGVEVVAVDFLAVDSQGRPLPDLKPSELTLKVDGKPREIRSLQFVRAGSTIASGPSSPAVAAPPPPFANNQDTDPAEPQAGTSRAVVFVIDHEHIRPGNSRVVPEIVEGFLGKLSAGDRAGLVTMPNGRVEVALTPDLDRVRRAVANVSGRTPAPAGEFNVGITEAIAVSRSTDPRNDPIVQEIADFFCRLRHVADDNANCMASTTTAVSQQAIQMTRGLETSTRALMTSLVEFLGTLAAVDGPKTLVFISEGFAAFPDTIQDLRNVTSAAGRSRVQVYAIQPYVSPIQDASRSLMPKTYAQDLDLQLSGLKDLSASTGGNLLRLSGSAENAVARIERETSAYYLLGFEPTPTERDGKSHTIDVRVQRSDVTVRARPEFTITKATKSASAVSDMPASAASPATPALMIRDDKKYRDLPMRALAYQFRGTDKTSVRVVVVVESPEPATRFSALAFSLADSSGKTIAEWTADANQLSARPLVSATMVPPGDYHLRVAATDARGRLGTLNYDFPASLAAAGSLRVGGLMLGVTSLAGAFGPRLLFGAGDEDVTGYFEVYGAIAANDATVAWELAASPDGPALAKAAGTVSPAADVDRFSVRGVLPIISLAPGDYVVRASVSVNGVVVGRLSRALRRQ